MVAITGPLPPRLLPQVGDESGAWVGLFVCLAVVIAAGLYLVFRRPLSPPPPDDDGPDPGWLPLPPDPTPDWDAALKRLVDEQRKVGANG